MKLRVYFFLLCFPLLPNAQSLSQEAARSFIQALAAGSDSLRAFVLPEELAVSERLGITYQGVRHKFMIGYDLPQEVREGIRDRSLKYELQVEPLEKDFSLLRLRVPEKDFERTYYFKGRRLVSPVYYFACDWPQRESRFFRFHISDTTRFNNYCVNRLESFVESTLEELEFSADEKENLQQAKIIYLFCADSDEIERLTGYRTRGMSILAYDYVVTTFNCHYHELVHLLVNYKLGNLPLYTHPFLQEGLAVALGGRGGKEPGVILDLGRFLAGSGFLDYRELLEPDNFAARDASLSYPLSGFFSSFLLAETGMKNYLTLYRKYSGTADEVSGMVIEQSDLPDPGSWQAFLAGSAGQANIYFESPAQEKKLILETSGATVYETGESYFFRIRDALVTGPQIQERGYRNPGFSELCKNRSYQGGKYLFLANSDEVNIYNLWSGNLIANFVCGFSLDTASVPERDGFFEFYVRKDLFEEPLEAPGP